MLERHVGRVEGVEVGVTDLPDHLTECGTRVDLRAQDDRVDEHPDQCVEFGASTARDRRREGDVGGTRQPGQHDGHRGVQHHERGHPVPAGEPVDRGRQIFRHLELHDGTAMGRHRRSRTIGRQFENVGQAGELLLPPSGPPAEFGVRVVHRPQDALLPQGDVRVLDVERRSFRRVPCGARGIGLQQVVDERPQRFAVRRDVMEDDHQDVIAGRGDEPGANGQIAGHVEAGGGEGLDVAVAPPLVDGHLVGGHDVLPWSTVEILGVSGTQHLMTADDVGESGTQRDGVEAAVQPHREGDVVGGR
ncbi:hypothetical protein BPODLACK_04661 [Gordonia sp. YY1]|nr:hypothetical protein BPODLACK_04661 [Gordonia sp. YY1]